MKETKRFGAAKKLVDSSRSYTVDEAMALVKQTATAKFDETIEVSIILGVDPRHADQMVRGVVVLPHGTGKTQRVLVFAKGDKATEAQNAGADIVGGEELVDKIARENFFDFDVCVATPDMMRFLGKLGKVLGPKGLMPNPKSGTVTNEIANAVKEIKAGKVEYRVDKTAIVHVPVVKASFDADNLAANFNTLIGAIIKAKPASAKGTYIKSVVLSSTMGPGIRMVTTF